MKISMWVLIITHPFWNVTRKLEKALGNDAHSCAWTNFSKYDVDAGRAYGEHEKEISTLDNLLKKEIEILKPKICVLLTDQTLTIE